MENTKKMKQAEATLIFALIGLLLWRLFWYIFVDRKRS